MVFEVLYITEIIYWIKEKETCKSLQAECIFSWFFLSKTLWSDTTGHMLQWQSRNKELSQNKQINKQNPSNIWNLVSDCVSVSRSGQWTMKVYPSLAFLPLFLIVSSSFRCVPNEINTWFFNAFKNFCSKANIHMFFKKLKSSLGVWLNLERYILHLFHTVDTTMADEKRYQFWSGPNFKFPIKLLLSDLK